MEEWIVDDRHPLEASARDLRRLLGGKGLNLRRLRARGLPVPAFVVVTSEAFDAVVAGDRELRGLLGGLEEAAPSELEAWSTLLEGRVRRIGCPLPLLRRLESALRRLSSGPYCWAVRSSAPGEDAERHTFAGLLD